MRVDSAKIAETMGARGKRVDKPDRTSRPQAMARALTAGPPGRDHRRCGTDPASLAPAASEADRWGLIFGMLRRG